MLNMSMIRKTLLTRFYIQQNMPAVILAISDEQLDSRDTVLEISDRFTLVILIPISCMLAAYIQTYLSSGVLFVFLRPLFTGKHFVLKTICIPL